MNKILFFSIFLIIIVAIGGYIVFNNASQSEGELTGMLAGMKATIYKSSSCGCCDLYTKYPKKYGFQVEIVDILDLDSIKTKYSIPGNMQSCHTTVMGDYFVEGHMPIEAINKLLEEKPDIAGIALPGMPSGSPGMPGYKQENFVVYQVAKDGSIGEFMRI